MLKEYIYNIKTENLKFQKLPICWANKIVSPALGPFIIELQNRINLILYLKKFRTFELNR